MFFSPVSVVHFFVMKKLTTESKEKKKTKGTGLNLLSVLNFFISLNVRECVLDGPLVWSCRLADDLHKDYEI